MAADSLTTNGVSGAVTISVSAGVYNEYMTLGAIAGASSTNTITIDGGSSATTSIVHDGVTENHVILLDGAKWVTISNLKIENSKTTDDAWGVRIANESDNATISNCFIQMAVLTAFEDNAGILMNGSATASSTEGTFGDNITVSNTTIKDGYYGFRIESLAWNDTSITISNNLLSGNIGYGMYNDKLVGLTLMGNTVDGASLTSKDGFYNFDLIDFNIQANIVDVPDYALYISDGNFDLTLPATRSTIINNMFASSDDEAMYLDDFQQCDVYHNTCATLNSSITSAYGVYTNDLDDVNIKNNIFYSAGAYAFYSLDDLSASTTVSLNYNAYYSGGANLAYMSFANIFADLAAWQSGDGGNNINSVEGDPVFGIGADLHVSGTVANDVGDNSVGITTDVDGDTRPLAPSTTVDIGADEFAAAACQQPSALGAYNLTTNGADIYWMTGGASNWQIQYGTSGFTLGSGTVVSATNDTTTLNTLMSATTYDVYVKDSCSTTDVSGYAGPYTFTTLCSPFVAPFTESFDGSALPNCWSISAVSGGPWTIGGNPNTSCGTVSDNTGNGGNFIWMDQSLTDATVVLEMNDIDVSALTIPYLEFYYWMCGTGYSPINHTIIQTWDGSAWNHLDSISTATVGWEEKGYDLSGRTHGTNLVRVRFIAESGGSGSDFNGDNVLDDITIKEKPSCANPSNLGATAITATSASIFWTTGGATNWNVEYGATGFTQGAGMMLNATNDTVNLTALSPSTDYEFYMRDSCGAGDLSAWAGPFAFTTLCSSFNTFPWVENFDAAASIPNCWENEAGDNSDWIFRSGSIGHGATGDNTTGSGNYAGVDDSHSNINDTVNNLLTPSFDLTSLTSPRLNFYHYFGNDATLTSTLYIDVYDGSTWSMSVATIEFTAAAWQQEFVDLTPYKSANSRIRFRAHETTDFNSDISIDDVTVEETPACAAPSALSVFGITASSASATWVSGGSSFEVVYGATGFTTGGTSMIVANDTANFTLLTEATTYDVYLREICGVGDTSSLVGPISFFTLCNIQNLPYAESFDANLGCFTAIDGGAATGDSWAQTVNASQNIDGTGYIRVDSDANGNGTHLIESAESPTIDASTVNNSLIIEFDHYYRSIAGDSGTVQVWDGSAWNNLASFKSTTGSWASPVHEVLDATAYANANFKVRLHYDDNNGWNWYWAVDNFSVEDKCLTQSLPYTENFDAGISCFSAIDGGAATGDSWAHSTSTTQNLDGTGYMRVDSDANGNGTHLIETLESPQIDATGITGTLLLEFDHYYRSIAGDSGTVQVWDGALWVNVATFTANTGGWSAPDHQMIDISAYANAELQVRFLYDDNNGWNWYWSVDNFSVAVVGCLQPSGLASMNVTETTADVYWTTGGASNWNVEYGPAGFVPGTGTIVAATNDTITLMSLTGTTTYDVYVQDSCGLGNVSSWAGPTTFTTQCAVFNTFPWIENFDAAAAIPNCWENEVGDDADWIFRSGSIGHGATSDNTTGSGNYAGVDDSQSNANDTVNNLLTPSFDLTSLVNPRLNFYHFIGNDNVLTSTLYIDIYDGTTWNAAVTTIEFTAAAWQQEFVNLTAYKSANTRIRFRAHESTDFNSDISIDDVTIEETPSCPVPTGITFYGITANDASATWVSSGSNFEVQYGTAGFSLGSGTVVSSSNDSISLTLLSAATDYDLYVREICGPGDTSAWAGPGVFTTLCSTFLAPYMESFDGSTTPNCWAESAVSGGPWLYSTGNNAVNCPQATDFTGNGGNYAWMDQSGADASVSLETPVIDVTALTTPYLEFQYWMCGAGYTLINMTVIETWDGAAWSLLDTLKQATSGWEVQGYDLTGRTYGTNLVRVRFTAESGGDPSDFFGDNAIDDVRVMEMPSCSAPSNLSVFNINDTSAALAWTSGGANNWNIEIGLAGFTPGTGLVFPVTNDTLGLQGFAPGTQYEFYVQDSCGLGDVSAWVGPFLFATTISCPPVETLPFFEFFDISEGCFDTIDGGAASGDGWAYTVNAAQNLDGTGYMRVDSDLNGNGTHMIETMVSPVIDASSIANGLILEFDHHYRPIGTDSGTVEVYDGATWVTVASYNTNIGAFGAPVREVIDVTAYANAAFQVRFHYDDGNSWAWYWAVDNFQLEDKCTTQPLPYTNNFDVDQGCFSTVDLGAAVGDGWAHTVNATQNLDGTGYMRVDSDLNGNGVEMREILVSPSIDASSITGTLMLEFDHYYRTIVGDTGWVNVWDGAAWNTVAIFTADIGAFGAPDQQAIDISAYANADLQVMFEYYDGNQWAWYWSVDNFSVAEVGCVAPSALGMASATQTSADIYWTSGGAANWNVEYGPTGFTPGTGTVVAATNDTITVSTLMASSCYDFYVQDSCGLGDVSSWTGPFNFCTACGPFLAPITESFDGTTTPLCWTEYAVTGGPWLYSTGLNSVNCPGAPDHTGNNGNYAWMDQSGTDSLVTLEMNDVDVSALTVPYLEFYYWMCGSGYTPINMTIIETWDGTNWVYLDTLTLPTSGWERQGYSLAGRTYGANLVKVRFTAETGGSGSDFFGDNGIDDVSIIEEPACLNPTNFMVTGNTISSIDLAWTPDANILSSTVQYGAPGFTPGTGTNVSTTTPGTISISGLPSGTCYEFYVQDSCTSVTAWVGPIIGCTGSVCSVTTIPTVIGDSANCGGGPITLTGTAGSGDIAWMLNGSVLGTGNSYSDSIGGTTVYDAADYSVVAPAVHLGPLTSIAAAGYGNFSNGQYFTVLDTIFIDSTTVNANGFVEASVIILDDAGGNLVQIGDTFTTGTAAGDYQVPVGVLLTPGNYFMGIDFHVATTGQLFRATSGASYPYILPGLMTIDSVNFAGARYYYTFDLVVSGACLGNPVPAIGFVPGANSGTSDTVEVCETNAAVDLASFLGPHDNGGTWVDVDASGALTDSIFNATLADTNNYYNFNYILAATGGCAFGDTATITVLVNFQRSAGSDGADTLCTNVSQLISLNQYLGAHTGGGSWTDVDSSGALLGIRVRPTNVNAPGTYTYRYTVAASGACPGESAIVTITYEDPVDAGMDNSDTLCNNAAMATDLSTYLSAGATAGGIWVDLDNAGGLAGSMLTSSVPAHSAWYTFAYVLESAGCGNDSAFIEIYIEQCDIGLVEQVSNQFNVYPNPTTGVFFIESLGATAKDMKIEVYSVNGQLLKTNKFAGYNETNTVDLTDLAKGVYNVKVFTEYGVEVHRITKQ